MEKVLIKSRLDCPPPEPHQLLREKDLIIQKLNEKLRLVESQLRGVLGEREFMLKLFSSLAKSVHSGSANLNSSSDDENTSSSRHSYLSSDSNSNSNSEIVIIESSEIRLLDQAFLARLEKQVELAARLMNLRFKRTSFYKDRIYNGKKFPNKFFFSR